ncbi:MAG TPA: hypothetical protein VEB86_02435, partial [Chryseosolibacter sp.]|nr:hypothetical protein [Chryseosolibacter sp.]
MKVLTLLLLAVLCSACFNLKEKVSKNTQTPRIVVIDSTLFRDSTLLMPASIRNIYRLTNFSPLWSDTAGFTKKADSLIAYVERSVYHGLTPSHYHAEAILAELLNHGDARLMKVDVLLTDAFFALSNDQKHGRLDAALDFIDRRAVIDSSAIAFLLNGMDTGSLERWLTPSLPADEQYKQMA